MTPWTLANYGSGSDILVDIDPANFTGLVDGDPIATGQDSSGNARHMTAAGAARPTWQTNELDGHAVARFDGTANVAGIADTGLSGQPFVLAAVARFAAPIAADASLFAGSGWAVRYGFVTPDAGIVLDLGSPLTVAVWEGAQPVTTPLIVVGGYDGDDSLWRATDQQQFVRAALGASGYPDAFKVGADAAGTGDFAAMDLARLIVANYTTEGDLDDLLGYLAWHYGLEATLPPDSPYLLSAPEVRTNEPSGSAYSVLSSTAFAALPSPADEELGQAYAVTTPAGESDFVALARKNAAGVNEWYEEGDTFQLPIAAGLVLSNVPAAVTVQGSVAGVDLRGYSEAKLSLTVQTAGVVSDARLVYVSDPFLGVGLTFANNMIDLSSTGPKDSDWEAIPSIAKTQPISIGLQTLNGNGTEDPIVIGVVAHFRR